jgi:hypothetical protein
MGLAARTRFWEDASNEEKSHCRQGILTRQGRKIQAIHGSPTEDPKIFHGKKRCCDVFPPAEHDKGHAMQFNFDEKGSFAPCC